jgi:hypothetical protein
MRRNNTFKVLTESLNPELSDWIKQPIHTGSIYIKPTEERKSICNKCFSYFYYIFCCIYIRSE